MNDEGWTLPAMPSFYCNLVTSVRVVARSPSHLPALSI